MDIGFTFWGDQTDTNLENNPTIEASLFSIVMENKET